jgi:predicted RNA binding protein YcfA (HicA-like mRNA interferase family)
MKLPRNLSGSQLSKTLCRDWGYTTVHQTGSHIILDTNEPFNQRIAVPNHKTLRIGTLNNILRTVAGHKGVSREKLISTL